MSLTLVEWSTRLTALADALSVPDGGFTIDPVTGASVHEGYAVAVHPDHEKVLSGTVASADLLAYVVSAQDVLALPRRVLGGWRDPETGKVYLDVSVVVTDKREAMKLARAHGQLALFDFTTMSSVRVDELVSA